MRCRSRNIGSVRPGRTLIVPAMESNLSLLIGIRPPCCCVLVTENG